MTELPEAVTRVLGFYDATAADLMTAGGVLRCGTCGAEQAVGDVASHLNRGWPECCGQTMTWMTLKLLAAETRDVPDGYELAAVPDRGWRVETGKLCARKVRRATCRRPSVAELNRRHTRLSPFKDGSFTADAWWPYCIDHLYGRWIEAGSVMHWILKEVSHGDS